MSRGLGDVYKRQDPIACDGRAFTTLEGYRSRLAADQNQRVLYSTDDVAQAGALNLWTSQGAEVLKLETVIDTQFIPWLELAMRNSPSNASTLNWTRA